MVPRARRPTRPARERASLHPCGAGREKKGGREATGRSAPGARVGGRVRCVCARGGAPQGAEESEKRGVDRKGSGWEGGSSPPSPHPPRLPFARLLPWGFGGRHRPPGRAARGDPRPPPRRVARDRRGDLPARLSRPTSPPRPSRFGSEGSGGGGPSPPHARLRLRRRSRPPVRDRSPARSLRCVSGWVAWRRWRLPRGAARPPRRLPAAGPGPVPSRSSVLRSGPSAPSPFASACPPSPGPLLRRPSGSPALFPALPAPRVPPARSFPRFPSEPPLPPSVARRGPGTWVRGKGHGWGGAVFGV